MLVCHSHLPGCLRKRYATETSSHCWKCSYFDLLLRNEIVSLDRQQCCPGCAINFVRSFDAAWNAHRRRMDNMRNCLVIRGNNESRSDGLFTKVIIHDAMLNPVHQFLAEYPYHSCINPRCHDAERVAGCNEAIVRFEVFKSALNDTNTGRFTETSAKRCTHCVIWMNEPNALKHNRVLPGNSSICCIVCSSQGFFVKPLRVADAVG
jgi:hypothetical protein